MVLGLHHRYRRQEPTAKPWQKFIDSLAYIGGVMIPVMTIPQLLKIIQAKSAASLSLISWVSYSRRRAREYYLPVADNIPSRGVNTGSIPRQLAARNLYLIGVIFWLIYGISRKEKVIIITYSLSIVIYGLVVIAIIAYR